MYNLITDWITLHEELPHISIQPISDNITGEIPHQDYLTEQEVDITGRCDSWKE